MRHSIVLFSITFYSCFSCQSNSEETTSNSKEPLKMIDQNYQLIQGIWEESQDDNAFFVIEKDSIYYFESEIRIKYEVKKDTLIIYYNGYTARNFIHLLTQDSLVFETEISVVNRLHRRK